MFKNQILAYCRLLGFDFPFTNQIQGFGFDSENAKSNPDDQNQICFEWCRMITSHYSFGILDDVENHQFNLFGILNKCNPRNITLTFLTSIISTD